MAAPLMMAASSLQSQRMTRAISSGLVQRVMASGSAPTRLAGVSMIPGSTALTVMPWRLSSRARTLVRLTTPALETAYAATFGAGTTAARDETLTMAPRPVRSRCGTAAWQAKVHGAQVEVHHVVPGGLVGLVERPA